MNRSECLPKAQRIVIKVGTNVITTQSGRLDPEQMKNLVSQMASLAKQGRQLLLVTSGAIAAGLERLGIEERPNAIPALQAAASVGQGLLLQQYTSLFDEYDIRIGQVLLTQFDITHRESYVNASNTFEKLLELGVIPVVNENDTTAVEEIKFGDNDTLAALVTNLAKADLLVILTDMEGLYTADPRLDPEARLISDVPEITSEIEQLAGDTRTTFGSGGMVTKIQAARIVTFAGAAMVMADGRKENVLLDIIAAKPVGTCFSPKKKKLASRKAWIAFGKSVKGTIIVDEGARDALLTKGKSLLPAGIVACEGDFAMGDAVNVADVKGNVFARGLINFSLSELDQVKGLKSSEVSKVLTEEASEEVIHRDCLVILK
ncbi:MAG: glutamate 5-kinase [Actinomycetota bacterium]